MGHHINEFPKSLNKQPAQLVQVLVDVLDVTPCYSNQSIGIKGYSKFSLFSLHFVCSYLVHIHSIHVAKMRICIQSAISSRLWERKKREKKEKNYIDCVWNKNTGLPRQATQKKVTNNEKNDVRRENNKIIIRQHFLTHLEMFFWGEQKNPLLQIRAKPFRNKFV